MPIFGKGVASGFPLEVGTPQATPAQGSWTPIPFLSPHRLTARARGGARYLLRMRNLFVCMRNRRRPCDYYLSALRVGQHVP